MTYAIAKTYSVTMQFRKEITFALLAACAFLVLIYSMNVYSVLSNSVALDRAEKEIASLSTSIQELDSKYLAISSELTPDVLGQYGLSRGKASAFITKSTSIGAVALSGNDL